MGATAVYNHSATTVQAAKSPSGSLTNYWCQKLYYPRPHASIDEVERTVKDPKQGRARILLPQKPHLEIPAGMSLTLAIRYFTNAIDAVNKHARVQRTLLDKMTEVSLVKSFSHIKFSHERDRTPEDL